MQQQRARMEARRTRLKKKKADINKYGSGGKKATTRDTSKDQSKQVLKYGSGGTKGVTRDTSKDTKRAAKKPAPKPAGVKPAQPVKKPAKPSAQANKGSGRDGKFGAGTYGKGRPSDKKKDQPKSSSRRTRRQNRRSTGVRGASTKPIDQLKAAIKAVDSKLKLTHKKGDIKKVGGSTYRWNGQRWQKLNRPF